MNLYVGLHWAECSTHFEALLSGAAYAGSLRHWAAMRAREPADANGTLAWLLRRRWGMTAWRATVRLLLDRLQYVGQGAIRANARRAAASDQANAARRATPHHATMKHMPSGSNHRHAEWHTK